MTGRESSCDPRSASLKRWDRTVRKPIELGIVWPGGVAILVVLLSVLSARPVNAESQNQRGELFITPPVTMQGADGQMVSATFVLTVSPGGRAMVTPTGIGRSPAFTIRPPAGATVSVKAARITGAPAGAPTRVEVAGRTGAVIATCFTAVTGVNTITIPAACQVPGSRLTVIQGTSLAIGLPPGRLPPGGGIPGFILLFVGIGLMGIGTRLRRC